VAGPSDPPPEPSGRGAILAAGGLAAAAWLGLWWVMLRPASGLAGGLVPLGLIVLATILALQLARARAEAAALRAELAALRTRAARATQDRAARRDAPDAEAEAEAEAQPDLPLGNDPGEDLPLPDLIRALHFPETEDDREGLRAMARALKDPRAGQVVQAAQDMLTLLSQHGLYVDDFTPDDPGPAAWRAAAAGDTAGAAALGRLGDAAPVDACRDKLRADAVYRDTAHHFLRRFDQLLADRAHQMTDEALEALAATRSARAFRLIGTAADIFGEA